MVIFNVHDVKNQFINEQERAVLERCVNNILYFHKNSRNVIRKCEHIAPHVSSTSTELCRQCCADFIECNVEHQK